LWARFKIKADEVDLKDESLENISPIKRFFRQLSRKAERVTKWGLVGIVALQLDEVAVPILLAWRLRRANALREFDPWKLISRAAGYLILNGPVTAQERWEENAGYSPSTLAAIIAALVCAALHVPTAQKVERRYRELPKMSPARLQKHWNGAACVQRCSTKKVNSQIAPESYT
jgi:hypothetical protein